MVGILVTLAAAGEDAYKVVVNNDNTLTSISRKDLSAIFLRRKTDWPDGTAAWPVDQVESARVRVGFSRGVHRRSAAAVKTYWLQILFSGRGVPPFEKETDSGVLDYVRSHPGAVGYISMGAPTDEVRVLNVVDR